MLCRIRRINVFTFYLFSVVVMIIILLAVMDVQTPSSLIISSSEEFFQITKNRHEIIPKQIRNKIIDTFKQNSKTKLLQLIRNYCLEPPSKEPYNLKEDFPGNKEYTNYKLVFPQWIFIDSIIIDLFKNRKPGFFVEAGAQDGEHLSNTLPLEKSLNWSGLLVEVEYKSYLVLKKKNRKSWSAPVCLATEPYPHEVLLTSLTGSNGGHLDHGAAHINKNITDIGRANYYESFESAFCIPTSSLLEALNVTHIDLFILDVEGVEMDILTNFPFDKISVDVWAVEHWRNMSIIELNVNKTLSSKINPFEADDDKFISFMEDKGYYLFDMVCEVVSDFIFIRRKSKIFEELEVPKNFWKRRGICLKKPKLKQMLYHSHVGDLRDKHHWPNLKFKSIN